MKQLAGIVPIEPDYDSWIVSSNRVLPHHCRLMLVDAAEVGIDIAGVVAVVDVASNAGPNTDNDTLH